MLMNKQYSSLRVLSVKAWGEPTSLTCSSCIHFLCISFLSLHLHPWLKRQSESKRKSFFQKELRDVHKKWNQSFLTLKHIGITCRNPKIDQHPGPIPRFNSKSRIPISVIFWNSTENVNVKSGLRTTGTSCLLYNLFLSSTRKY